MVPSLQNQCVTYKIERKYDWASVPPMGSIKLRPSCGLYIYTVPETWGKTIATDLNSCQKTLPPTSHLSQQAPRAFVPLAFSSFPSALWNSEPFSPTYLFLRLEELPDLSLLVFFCVSSCLQLTLNLSPRLLAKDTSHSISQARLPRVAGTFFSVVPLKAPTEFLQFCLPTLMFSSPFFFLSAQRTCFSTLSFGSTVT